MSDERIVKRIDEEWKERVEREKAASGPPPRGGSALAAPKDPRAGEVPPPADFAMFVSSLSMQAMIALGERSSPQSNELLVDLETARDPIYILGILQEKTKGNLTPDETSLLDGVLYELRMKYVAKGKAS